MKQKSTLALAVLLAATVPAGYVLAQPPLLTYRDVVQEARRYEKLEGSERATSSKVLFQKSSARPKALRCGQQGFLCGSSR